jgi:hypothetical protein
MPSNAVQTHTCREITDQNIHDLGSIECYELVLPNLTELDANSVRYLRGLTKPQVLTFSGVTELTAETALELADGFRAQVNFPAIKSLTRAPLRALSTWKRGWITFENIQTIEGEDDHFELALHCGNLSLTRLYIQVFGYNVDHQFRNRSVPLLIAGQHLNAALIRLLIELGADPNVRSHKDGDTILHMVCRARANGLITFLLDHVDLKLKNLNGRTAQDEYMDEDPIRERLTPHEPPPLY